MYEDWPLLELRATELRSDPQSAAVLASSDCTAVRAAVFAFGMVALAGLASPVELRMLYTRCQAANHRGDPEQHRERFQLGQTPGYGVGIRVENKSRVAFLVHDSIALWIFEDFEFVNEILSQACYLGPFPR